MKKNIVFLLLAVSLVMSGCSVSDSYSKNMRASTVQATANVATKALLDEVPAEKYDATKAQVIEVCGEVGKFLDTGKIGDLPIDKARDAVVAFMVKKGWAQYTAMVIAVFDIAAAQTVPLEKIGPEVIAITKLGLDSASVSAETSRAEWRRPAKRGAQGVAVPPNRVRLFRQ